MSRGVGRVQYALLSAVEQAYSELRPELFLCLSTLDLGLNEHPESRRRAAHQLEAAGLIELRKAWAFLPSDSEHFRSGHVRRVQLYGRLPYREADMRGALELNEEYEQHMVDMLNPESTVGERSDALNWVLWYEAPLVGLDFLGFEMAQGHVTNHTLSPTAALRLYPRL